MSRLALRARRELRRPRRMPPWPWAIGVVLAGAIGLGLGLDSGRAWLAQQAEATAAGWRTLLVSSSASRGHVVQKLFGEGRQRTSMEELAAALEPFIGQPLLAVDPELARARVERLPWVESASVHRQFPDTLVARLVEREPMALWRTDGRVRLIDRAGGIIEVADLRPFLALPLLLGRHAPEDAAGLFDTIASEPALARRVTGASRIGTRRWNVYLDGRVEVRLPADDPAAAWRRLAARERDEAVLARAIDAIDLRLADRMIVRLIDGGEATRQGGRA